LDDIQKNEPILRGFFNYIYLTFPNVTICPGLPYANSYFRFVKVSNIYIPDYGFYTVLRLFVIVHTIVTQFGLFPCTNKELF